MLHVERIDEFLAQEARSGSEFSHLPWAERRSMLQDDLSAGRSVTLILTTIVAGGMLLMAATVAYIVF